MEHEENTLPALIRDNTIEVVADTYKGQAVITVLSTSPTVNLTSGTGVHAGGTNRNYFRATSTGLERIADAYRSSATLNGSPVESASDSDYVPADSRPARLVPGEAFNWDFTETRTYWSTSSPTQRTTNYRWVGKTEFLGIEDVTLSDGTVIKNACKLKETDLTYGATTAYSLYWIAAGLRDLKYEYHATSGAIQNKSAISKILVAP